MNKREVEKIERKARLLRERQNLAGADLARTDLSGACLDGANLATALVGDKALLRCSER